MLVIKRAIKEYKLQILAVFIFFIAFSICFQCIAGLEALIKANAIENEAVLTVESTPEAKKFIQPLSMPVNTPQTALKSEQAASKYITLTVKATAYCPCKSCSGKWGDNTAMGVKAEQGRTIAVDPSVIAYGSEVIIDGKTYIAEDCGAAIKGNEIDLYFESHEQAQAFGVQQKQITVKATDYKAK